MKGDPKVLKLLQQAITAELTATHQYLLHGHLLNDWGIDKLGAYELREADDERGHTNKFIERMMFLEGIPDLTKMDKITVGKDVVSMLKSDLKLELEAVKMYREAASICEHLKDYGTSELFEDVLMAEEGHVDHLEKMLRQIDLVGVERFIEKHMSPASAQE